MTASGNDDGRVPNEHRRTAARQRRDRPVAYYRVDDGPTTAAASEDRRTAQGDATGGSTTSRRGVLAAGAALAGAATGRAAAGPASTGRTDRGAGRSDGSGAVAAQGTRPVNREGWFVSDVTAETQRTYAGASATVYNEAGRGRRAVTLSVTIYDDEGDDVRSGTVSAVLEDGEQRRLSQWWRPNPEEIETVETADVLVVQER